MKSVQKKKLADRRAVTAFRAAEARENNAYLMAMYAAFIPNRVVTDSKFVTDKWGNRIRRDQATLDDKGRWIPATQLEELMEVE